MSVGETVLDLPWVCPCAASLLALARQPIAAAWSTVRTDPACVLLLARHALPGSLPLELKSLLSLIREGDALQASWMQLQKQGTPPALPTGFVDWNQSTVAPVYHSALCYAQLAHRLANENKRTDPELAWLGGLLAPLGWLALAAVSPAKVETCLQECRAADDVAAVQKSYFGMDITAVARRLQQNWRLPNWLRAITGSLSLPPKMARSLGADEDLFRIVQLAVALVDQREQGLKLVQSDDVDDAIAALELDRVKVKTWCEETLATNLAGAAVTNWEPPFHQPLLLDVLEMALENRQLRDKPGVEHLQCDIDALHHALHDVDRLQEEQLHSRKMNALAEFAAGAAHEINNPLAVMSGQAQYLLTRESDPDRRQALQKIVGQTQRVHQILTDVLQFARPTEPRKQLVDVAAVVREAAGTLQELANERKVRLIRPEPPTAITLHADPAQICKVLTCLLRNAIEAAPEEGWAEIRVELPQPDILHLIVEDNGKGLAAAEASHLFDPFFSGREAGRGRGMGLPVAWRLARLHGGDVFLASRRTGPTRFIVQLPLPPVSEVNGHANGVGHLTLDIR